MNSNTTKAEYSNWLCVDCGAKYGLKFDGQDKFSDGPVLECAHCGADIVNGRGFVPTITDAKSLSVTTEIEALQAKHRKYQNIAEELFKSGKKLIVCNGCGSLMTKVKDDTIFDSEPDASVDFCDFCGSIIVHGNRFSVSDFS